MASIKIRATRPLFVHGRAYKAGEVFAVDDPLLAGSILDGGRTELVDADARAAIDKAARGEAQRLVRNGEYSNRFVRRHF